ncbi:GDP-mannose 4,6-dehydratase [Chloroflexota bacterium]
MTQGKSELKRENILVTGGAGFIGSHIVDRLCPENNVFVLDNLFTGSMSNLEKSKDRITFIKGDIRDKDLVSDTVTKVDYIFHLAAHVGNIRSLNDPYFDMEVNIKGMLNLLEACRNTNIKRLVYSSSGAIFGEAKYLPIDEDHPLNAESPYAVSKLAAEKYAFAYYKVYGIPTTTVRYFNAYGPRQDSSEYANAVSIFLSLTRQGKPVTIFGDGEQSRDFIFINDMVDANVLAATHPAAIGEIFNISTGEVHNIKQLIDTISKVSGREVPFSHADFRAGEVRHSKANIDKARNILDFSPQTSLEEGLRQTWQELIQTKE